MREQEEESEKVVASKTELKTTPTTSPPEVKPTAPPSEKSKPYGGDSGALKIVVTEKRLALIKAWEDNEKTNADNKAYTKNLAIGAWENTKKAAIEVELKQIEEDIENEKAKQREKMKNKMTSVHKEAEEKRTFVEAKKREEVLKVEEAAAKFRASGTLPSRLFKCFGY